MQHALERRTPRPHPALRPLPLLRRPPALPLPALTLPALTLLALTLLAGCGTDPAGPGDVAATFDTPIRTDDTSYSLRREHGGLATDIAITFENRSDRTMYIVNCHGLLSPVLEKRIGDAWVPYWAPVLPQCLSEPIVVAPGATLERRLHIWGALPGQNMGPEWASHDVPGTYRLVLHSLVHDYDPYGYPFGEDVPREQRVSNPFTLRR